MHQSTTWNIPATYIPEHAFMKMLEQDPEIQQVRDSYFGEEILGDSEEGQALLGRVAAGQATIVTRPWQDLALATTYCAGVVAEPVMSFDQAYELNTVGQRNAFDTPINMHYPTDKEPVMIEEAPANLELTDELAMNTGAGSDRSRLAYMLGILRDDLFTHKRLGSPMFSPEQELEAHISYPDLTTAYVHLNYAGLVGLLKDMYQHPATQNEAFKTVENLGFSMWSPQGENTLYLNIDGNTVKIK